MSDLSESEHELLSNNVLTFQNQGTTVCAKGPNNNSTSISSISFRNNMKNSTMNMPWNLERPRQTDVLYDQRSFTHRRGRESPMSFHSASGLQPRNFYYPSRMSSHRSMYYGRSGSPGSVRSSRTIDSNTSMSAKAIALAFQSGNFTKFDFKIIKDAYNKYMKTRHRRRVEKKRNIRTFLKGFRRKSGGDSGDQASNSSISSDDGRSIRSSRSAVNKDMLPSFRSTRMELFNRRTVREHDLIRGCNQDLRPNPLKNTFPIEPPNVKETNPPKWPNSSISSQKERFRSNFLLPSQRFNQSAASTVERYSRLESICEDNMLDTRNKNAGNGRKSNETDSEQDEIFGKQIGIRNNNNRKRNLDEDHSQLSPKRTKLSSTEKRTKEKSPDMTQVNKLNTSIKHNFNDYIFAKPQLPVKKLSIVKNTNKIVKSKALQKKSSTETKLNSSKSVEPIKEKVIANDIEQPVEKFISSSQKAQANLIAKSIQCLAVDPKGNTNLQGTIDKDGKISTQMDVSHLSSIDMSMRPSFIKRKLFTQKIDETAKNSSSDSLQADSPQNNIYSKIQKEKNKARKLATQSCLNREIGDDSNLLDLIHKFVPVDRMNATTANRTEISKTINASEKQDKWDVTSIISTCNDENVSDTFTDDEEIFSGNGKEQQEKNVTREIDKIKVKSNSKETSDTHQRKNKGSPFEQTPVHVKQIEITKNSTTENVSLKPANNNKKQKNVTETTIDKNKDYCVAEKNTKNTHKQTVCMPVHAENEEPVVIPIEKQNEIPAEKQIKNVVKKPSTTIIAKKPTKIVTKIPVEVSKKGAGKPPSTPVKAKSPNSVVVLQKLNLTHTTDNLGNKQTSPTEQYGTVNSNVYKSVKSFWDTDAESDIEATPISKRKFVEKGNSGASEKLPVVNIIDKDISSISEDLKSNNNNILNSTLENLQKKLANNPNHIESLSEKEKNESSQSKGPPNVNSKNKNVKNINVSKVSITKAKQLPNKKNSLSNETSNKRLCSSSKENKPPINKAQNIESPKKSMKSPKKTTGKSRFDESVLSPQECRHLKVHNNTLRIRPQRMTKKHKCCEEPDTSEPSANDSSHYRSLRSRKVDLSSTFKSDGSTLANKPPAKRKKNNCKDKVDTTIPSDLSFTLATEAPVGNRTIRAKRASTNTKTRKSNISFTLNGGTSPTGNNLSCRTSKRIRELEALHNNSVSLYKESKRPLLSRKLAPEKLPVNQSKSRR